MLVAVIMASEAGFCPHWLDGFMLWNKPWLQINALKLNGNVQLPTWTTQNALWWKVLGSEETKIEEKVCLKESG